MNIIKKLKDVVNDIIPNEIKNNDLVKSALVLGTGYYFGKPYASDAIKDLFKSDSFIPKTIEKGKGFLFGTTEYGEGTSRVLSTPGKLGFAGKFDLKTAGKALYKGYKARQAVGSKKEQAQELVPSMGRVDVSPSRTAQANIGRYRAGDIPLIGMTDSRVQSALVQLVSNRRFIQAMNGEIPLDEVPATQATGPTVKVGSATLPR